MHACPSGVGGTFTAIEIGTETEIGSEHGIDARELESSGQARVVLLTGAG